MPSKASPDAPALPPDYAQISIDHFGSARMAEKLAEFARLISRYQSMETLEGAMAAPSRSRLQQAAKSVQTAAKHLSGLSLAQWLEAYGVPEVPQATAEMLAASGAADVSITSSGPNRMHAFRAMEAMLSTLRRVGPGLERLGAGTRAAPAHRPSRKETRDFALDELEHIWKAHRSDPPTQSRTKGGFGSLVEAVLSEPPVEIPAATLRKAVAARYPSRSGQRGPTISRPAAPPAEARLGHVVIVGRNRPLPIALAQEYDKHAASVTLVHPLALDEQRVPPTIRDIQTIPLRLEELNPTLWDREIGEAAIDLLIFAEDLTDEASSSLNTPWDVAPLIWSQRLGQAVTRPHLLLRVARHRLRLAPQPRVVVVTSQAGSASLASGPWDPQGETIAAALHRLAAGWARQAEAPRLQVFAICPTWGRGPDGRPMAHSHPPQTAAALRETIARLTPERSGLLLDLAGSSMPR